MAVKSVSGYFMAFDGDRGGEPRICLERRQAGAAEQGEDGGRKTRSVPANKGKTLNRAARPKQVRRKLKSAAETQSKYPVAPPDEIEESLSRMPPAGSLARTKRLIMAALRVWELKQGIRE
jgi:hypothetical protein